MQFYRPAGEVLFELALDVADGSYAVNGLILLGVQRSDLRDLRVAAQIGEETVILSEARDAFFQYLTITDTGTPVGPFFDTLDDRTTETLRLESGKDVWTIPLAGYDEARKNLGDCTTEFLTRTETNRRPQLLDFNGHRAVKAAARLAGLRWQDLNVTLKVNQRGKVIDCSFDQSLEEQPALVALCGVLARRSTFEPGRNEKGELIVGRYQNPVSAFMVMGKDGHLYEENLD